MVTFPACKHKKGKGALRFSVPKIFPVDVIFIFGHFTSLDFCLFFPSVDPGREKMRGKV